MVNMLSVEALKRVGAYYYLFPKYAQGKKIIWQGRDKDGRAFLDYIPSALIKDKNETEMRLEFTIGSSLQIIGTDNIDSIVGTNPIGCVFSEYSLQNPRAWDLIRPILRENGGWAWFIYTPRGRNHGYRLFRMAKSNPNWHCLHLTIRDTFKDDARSIPVLTDADIEEERAEGMDEDLIQQEYFCSFDGSVQGSYYARQLALAHQQDRITTVPWITTLPVFTAWDIGVGDSTAIWFLQLAGDEVRFIDYYEAHGHGAEHYHKVLREKPYAYEAHWLPHDAAKTEWGTGKTIREQLTKMGVQPIRIVPKLSIDDGIQAVRKVFPRFRFDQRACQDTEYNGHSGLDCVAFYHKEWDEERQCYGDKPEHDWSSHGADALRMAAVMIRDTQPAKIVHRRAAMLFNPLTWAEDEDAEMEFDPVTHQVE